MRKKNQKPRHTDGFAGVQGKPAGKLGEVLERIEKEVISMPR